MDELMNVLVISNLEHAENNYRPNVTHKPKDPFTELNERQFVNMFRLSKELCRYLIEYLESYMRPQLRSTDLDLQSRVLAALRFFGSESFQLDVGSNKFIELSQSSVSKCVKEVVTALGQPAVFDEWVKFPKDFEELNKVRQRFYEQHGFPGVIGCIDCTHVAIVPPGSDDLEHPEHLYVNRKNYHSINVQLICDSNLKIINVNAKYPGSTNDAFIWCCSNVQNVLRNIHARGSTDYFLLGGSGYPLRTWLLTSFNEVEDDSPESYYNTVHKNTRVKIECCNGVLKARFRCLHKNRVLHYAPEIACNIIITCVVLHNICLEYRDPQPDDIADAEENIDEDGNLFSEEDNLTRKINPELANGRRARMKLVRPLNAARGN